jgi:tetratricopeptide (TPR) repeat protein
VTHIPEEDLALYAYSPDVVEAARRRDIQSHLSACSDCSDSYDSFVATVADEDDAPFLASEGTAATLAYGARVAEENRDAAELLKDYFAEPERAAWRNLAAQRRYIHGGVVRRLAKQAYDVCASEPLHALTFADAAIAVAEAIPENAYPKSALHDLRGRAWKERANALNRLGEPAAALDALERSERAYRKLRANNLGLGNVSLVRAAALLLLERLPEADAEAARAERRYEEIGDFERRTKTRFLRGNIRYESHDFGAAATLFRGVIAYGEEEENREWIAKGSYALGCCVLETNDIETAAVLFSTALAIFRTTGPETDRIAAEWGMARVLLARGLYKDALRRLQDVQAQFTARGMTGDAAIAGLDAMEAMVALGMLRDVARLARAVFQTFTEAGMLTSALTALAYLHDAATAGTITRYDVREIRRFVRRVDRDPHLLFVPPRVP